MDEKARRWKELFIEALLPHKTQPLLFSGGMDSLTILAGLRELGEAPHLYTYFIKGKPSKDLLSSQKNAQRLGLKLTVVEVQPENLLSDVKELISFLPQVSKAAIQCGHPMKYLTQQIRDDGFLGALCGTVGIVEDNKKINLILSKTGEEGAREYRRKLFLKAGLGGTAGMRLVAKHYGIDLVEPFRNQNLIDYQLSLDMADLNFPRQKGIALRAFPSFFSEANWRRNSPHQINSGIRELHDTLLTDPTLNTRQNKAVIAVYNNLRKKQRCPS